jgi:5-methylcytosine-specific restriction endonuclease McrA
MKRSKPLKRSPIKRTSTSRSRRRIRTRPPGTIPLQVREAVKKRDGLCCRRCRRFAREGQAHHMLLKSQGGPNTVENLIWLCPCCHDYVHAHPKESKLAGWIIGLVRLEPQERAK